MNFKETLEVAKLVVKSGNVLYIEGDAGVGKTSLINELARSFNTTGEGPIVEPVVLFGSVLKEGEIGGMPITRSLDIEGTNLLVNDYSLHSAMKKLYEINLDGNIPLLFIDELNRSEFAVQQELMQVLLAREINGNPLPENTLLMAAGNLEDSNSDGIDYQVNVMNPALKDRMTIVKMDADVKTWLDWGSKEGRITYDSNGKELSRKTNIHPNVLEFIATHEDMLHIATADSTIHTTPRSWEKASDMLYESELNSYDYEILSYALRGTVGDVPSSTFLRFLEENEVKLLGVEDILIDKPLSTEVIEKIKGESITRLFLTFNKLLNEGNRRYAGLRKNQITKAHVQQLENFVTFLESSPKDTMYGMIHSIVNSDPSVLYDVISDHTDDFLLLHARTKERLSRAKF